MFLREAELSPEYEVDWSQYDGWGGRDTICSMPFDDWWRKHWVDLFGTELEKGVPRYQLQTKSGKAKAIHARLLVYRNRNIGTHLEIAKKVCELTNSSGNTPSSLMGDDNQIIQSRVGRFLSGAEEHLNNVCVGKFP